MSNLLHYYLHRISKLRTASGKKLYPETTLHRAPHKPILLLTILDLIELGEITSNFVLLSPDLAEIFSSYWEKVMPPNSIQRLFLPFFHLQSDSFWHLIPHTGQEVALQVVQQISGAKQLRQIVAGAKFDDDLFNMLLIEDSRDQIRTNIITTYFSESMYKLLIENSFMNDITYQYSLELLSRAHEKHRKPVGQDADKTDKPVRDQGFRRAIVTAYDHRCVLCGIRLLTYEGRTSATAAHIVPWSMSYNDDPTNGLCLCRQCHWIFDIGLASISAKYRIRLSEQILNEGNRSGYLSTLENRPIFEPTEDAFNPDIDSLRWHKKHVFLN
jgi:putative restriction endonuclease